jgi:hypothetical protein
VFICLTEPSLHLANRTIKLGHRIRLADPGNICYAVRRISLLPKRRFQQSAMARLVQQVDHGCNR